jgi:O-antigen/teichoic acid export membrane protein
VASLFFTAVIALFVAPLLKWLGEPAYIPLMQRSLLLIALYGVMEYFKYLFEALHRLQSTFFVTALEHGFKFLLVIVLFRWVDPFDAIIISFTIAVGLALIAGVVATMRVIPNILTAPAPAGMMRQAYFYSLPVFLISIAGFVSLEIDTIMLKILRSDYETGIYSTAKQIIMFLPHIALIFAMGTIPGIAVFGDLAKAKSQRHLYYRIMAWVAGIYFLICLAVAALALWGMGLFFRPEYHGASAPLLALIPFAILNAAIIYSGSLMVYRGLAWQRSINVVLTVVANVILNLWLIPRWGATGAAVASSLAYVPYCFLNLRAAHRAFAVGAPGNFA